MMDTNISDKEYQSFSKGHRAMILYKDKNTETDGTINVESIGGNLLIQHYSISTKDRDKLVMRSEKSDAYLLLIIHCHKTFIDLLKKSSEPRIVNVSTSVGSLSLQSDPNWQTYDYAKYAIYGSSKSAVNMYTVHLAYELRGTNSK